MNDDSDTKDEKNEHFWWRHSIDESDRNRYFDKNDVPINVKGITDKQLYEKFEYRCYTDRGQDRPRMRLFTYEELKAAHKHLFQDVWSWAGETRTYKTDRKGQVFTWPENIERDAKNKFKELNSENNLKGLSRKEFASRAAHYVNELNTIHSFVEGNGRVIRSFLDDLAANAGHKLDFSRIEHDSWYKASRIGYLQNHEPMALCIEGALVERQQNQNIKQEPKTEVKAKKEQRTPKTIRSPKKDKQEPLEKAANLHDEITRLEFDMKSDSSSSESKKQISAEIKEREKELNQILKESNSRKIRALELSSERSEGLSAKENEQERRRYRDAFLDNKKRLEKEEELKHEEGVKLGRW